MPLDKSSFKKKNSKTLSFLLPDCGLNVVMREQTAGDSVNIYRQRDGDNLAKNTLILFSVICTFENEGCNADDLEGMSQSDYILLNKKYEELNESNAEENVKDSASDQ